MRSVPEPPIHVEIVGEDADPEWRRNLADARGVIQTALHALEAPGRSSMGEKGVRRTTFEGRSASIGTVRIETDIGDPATRSPETAFHRSGEGGTRGVVLQCPMPLRRIDGPAQGVRVTADIALRIIGAALEDETERSRASEAAALMVEAIGRRACEAQGHDDLDSASVRLPSPFDLPGCRVWTGSTWEETLDARHDAWRLVDAVSVILRVREDGMLLMHVSTRPTGQPNPDLGPLDALRALATLPPAPPPRRVAGEQKPS